MRFALLVGVGLCVLGLALAAPQLATDDPPVSNPFTDTASSTPYGPVEGSYFRAMSYDRYTGTGWERTADPEPVGVLRPPPAPADRVRIHYEVAAPVRTAPAPWRPTAYEGPAAESVAGSIQPTETYRPGDAFTVTARRPAAGPRRLRTAGTDYPDRVRRYRQLPDDTPPALGAAAANITAGAATQYGRAVAVTRWLRTTKNYSLTVDRPDAHVATAFVTEMDAGFCEYFATAMVAMLRAEGVPARYVTGYTPYEQVNATEHVIRGSYSHTWVEVYFPDVGWIPFDPTPPGPRRTQRGVATDPVADAATAAAPTTGVPPVTTVQDAEPAGYRQLAADVDIEGPHAAGARVTVRVTDPGDGTPIEGAQVRFDGRPVGTTGANGTVRVRLPYRESVTVAAYRFEGEGEPPPVLDTGPTSGSGGPSTSIRDLRYAAPRTEISASLTDRSETVLFRATVEAGSLRRPARRADSGPRDDGASPVRWRQPRASVTATQGSERTVRLNTTIDVTVTPASGGDGARHPGEPLLVEAAIAGTPVPNATVTAGERTATTADNGTATIPAPFERPATVTVERGAAAGDASVLVRGELLVTTGGAEVAGERLRVTATLSDGTPVSNATVTSGVGTATTGPDGVATVPAPYEPPWTVAARRGDFAERTSVPVATGTGTLVVDGATPGAGRTIRATFRGVPVRNATVRADGTPVGRTDRFGRATVRIPYADAVVFTVDRGRVTAERTVAVPTDATVDVEPAAVPGRTVDLSATVDGAPLPAAPVLVNGRAVAETDADGDATITVPFAAPTVTVGVRRGDVAGHTDLPAVPVAWTGLLAGLAGAAVIARRRDVVGVLRDDPRAIGAAVRRRIAGRIQRSRDEVAATLADRDAARTPTPAGPSESSHPPAPAGVPAADNGVYRAWAAFVDGLDADGDEPPAAVAERAVAAGLPEPAIEELTGTFRAVRYGDAEPTPDRERRARDALDRIREAAG